MKLKIKKQFFDDIKSGKKKFEFRDAHLTFQCKETGEELRKDVVRVSMVPYTVLSGYSEDHNFLDCFTDDLIITFELGD